MMQEERYRCLVRFAESGPGFQERIEELLRRRRKEDSLQWGIRR